MNVYNQKKLIADYSEENLSIFRKNIRKSNYKFIFNSLLGCLVNNDIWVDKNISVEKVAKHFNEYDVDLFKFLFYGEPINESIFTELMGNGSKKFLLEINFMEYQGGLLMPNGYSVIVVENMFLIVSTPNEYRGNSSKFVDIYIGQDSFSLMNMVTEKKFDNILDLCAGSGIQGLNVVKLGSHKLTSVEINENAYNSILINSSLNELNNKVEVLLSDLYNDVGEKKYDCILSNPPYVPAPKDINIPICGDGGESGLEIAEKIIRGYNHYLLDNGYAYMVLECMGDDKGPYIIDLLKKYIARGIINIRILTSIPAEMQIEYSVNFLSHISENINKNTLYQKYNEIFNKYRATKMYSIVVEYIREDTNLRINKIEFDNLPFESKYYFNKKIKITDKNICFKNISIDNLSILNLNSKIYEMILNNNTIKEVFDSLSLSEYEEYLRTFIFLKENNILIFK